MSDGDFPGHCWGLLELLAEINGTLQAFAADLRRNGTCTSVTTVFDCRNYQAGTVVELCVDATLDAGDTLAWWLDISRAGAGLNAEASLRTRTDDGQDAVWQRSEEWHSLEAAELGLKALVVELLASSPLGESRSETGRDCRNPAP